MRKKMHVANLYTAGRGVLRIGRWKAEALYEILIVGIVKKCQRSQGVRKIMV
jgi:hypothetical protein